MKELFYVLGIYLLLISVIAVFLTVYDKRQAIRHGRRIPERTLLLVSALGGSVAMLLTMHGIRHKTQHKKFMIGIPLIILLQAATVFCFWYFRFR